MFQESSSKFPFTYLSRSLFDIKPRNESFIASRCNEKNEAKEREREKELQKSGVSSARHLGE
jgi:hypothetical protein